MTVAARYSSVQLDTLPRVTRGQSTTFEARPPISTSIYAAGDVIGDRLELPGAFTQPGGTSHLQSVAVLDLGNQGAALDILLFGDNPAASTVTDNAAFVLHASDAAKYIGRVQVGTADYIAADTKRFGVIRALGLVLANKASSQTLWAVVLAVASPTYTATDNLIFHFGLLVD